MNSVHEYDYETCNAGTPEEYDSVTLNGHEFARIIQAKGGSYEVRPTSGSCAGRLYSFRWSHYGAFEDCMTYAATERLPEKFTLEGTE
jgi:hypothetical protein